MANSNIRESVNPKTPHDLLNEVREQVAKKPLTAGERDRKNRIHDEILEQEVEHGQTNGKH